VTFVAADGQSIGEGPTSEGPLGFSPRGRPEPAIGVLPRVPLMSQKEYRRTV
jgi:hypothetical protein